MVYCNNILLHFHQQALWSCNSPFKSWRNLCKSYWFSSQFCLDGNTSWISILSKSSVDLSSKYFVKVKRCMLTCWILILKLAVENTFLLRFSQFGCLHQIPFSNIWSFAQNYVLHHLAVQVEFRLRKFGYTGVKPHLHWLSPRTRASVCLFSLSTLS